MTTLKPDKLTLAACEKALAAPAKDWVDRCYEVASALVRQKLVRGTAVYGHWLGPVDKKSSFYEHSRAGFVHHGWIVLSRDKRILDPTRWAFEMAKPYLFLGLPGELYDEGGNRFRTALRGPVPEWSFDEPSVMIWPHMLSSAAWDFVEKYLTLIRYYDVPEYKPGTVTREQLLYLANASLSDLGEHAKAIYKMLITFGHDALIPIDNLRRVNSGRWQPKATSPRRAPSPRRAT